MEKLSKRSAAWLLRHNAIETDDMDVFIYGFEVAFQTALDVASLLILALCIRQIPQTVVYHIAFVPLRQCAGGYHASTRLRCFVISTLMWLASMGLVRLVADQSTIVVFATALSCCAIWLFAPVEHENAPMSREKRIRMKRACRVMALICTAVVVILNLIGAPDIGWIGASLMAGMASAAVMLCCARLAEARR